MANNDIVFKASIDEGGQGAKSLSDLKKEFTATQKELSKLEVGTDAYYKTLQRLGTLKDDIGDLRDTISALNPEGKVAAFSNVAGKLAGGFQAATGAAALFGVEAEEVEKTLLKVQAATAFAEGIKSLTGLTDAFKVLGVVLKANPIFILAGVITAITAAVKIYNDNFGETARITKQLTEEIQRQNDAYSELEGHLNTQIRLARAYGESQESIIKRQINLEHERELSITKQIEGLEKLIYLNGQNTKENLDQLEKLNAARDEAIVKQTEGLLQLDKLKADSDQKDAEAKQKKLDEDEKKRKEEIEKKKVEEIALTDWLNQAKQKQDEEADEAKTERQEKLKNEEDLFNQVLVDSKEKSDAQEDARIEKRDAERLAKAKAAADLQESTIKEAKDKGFQAAKGLSDAYFAYQLSRAKGNAAEELKIRKKQFEVDKAFSIARAVIDGVRSVQAALTIPPPAGLLLAAANGVLAAANIAKIAATKFDGGAASAGSSPDISTTAPSIETPRPPTQQTTNLDSQGNNLSRPQVIEAVVYETKMTERQTRVATIKDRATFG